MATLTIRRSALSISLVCAVLVAFFFANGATPVAEATYTATIGTIQCASTLPPDANPLNDCASVTTAATDINQSTYFSVPAADYNFSNFFTFVPRSYVLHSSAIPIGAIAGQLTSLTTLGLANGACDGPLTVNFIEMNAVTGPNPDADGDNDYLDPDPVNDPTPDVRGTLGLYRDDSVAERDAELTPANNIPAHVERWPSFNSELLDPDFVSDGADGLYGTGDDIDGPALPILPSQRYSGDTLIAGLSILLQFLQFDEGDFSGFFAYNEPSAAGMYPHPLADLYDTNIGAPSMVILNDPTAPLSPGISDFCAPLNTTGVFWGKTLNNPCTPGGCVNINDPIAPNSGPTGAAMGAGTCSGNDEGGCSRLTTPADNSNSGVANTDTHMWAGYSQSLRNADTDPYENALDTCPLQTNTQNPKLTAGADAPAGDMLDPVCDPNPAVNENGGNIDLDTVAAGGWTNANDTCPRVLNNDQSEAGELNAILQTTAPYGGPSNDSIGDACEPDWNGDTIVGTFECISGAANCTATTADHKLRPNRADGTYEVFFNTTFYCIGSAANSDGNDGLCDETETALGNADQTGTPESFALHFPFASAQRSAGAGMAGMPIQVCNDGVDNDLDTFTDSPTSEADRVAGTFDSDCHADMDGDGYSNYLEFYLGTAPLNPCGTNAGVGGANSGWPADLDANAGMGGGDLNSFLFPLRGDTTFNKFNHPASEGAATKRWDIDQSGTVGGGDLNALNPAVVAGSSRPPMMQGDIGFGNSCPFPSTP